MCEWWLELVADLAVLLPKGHPEEKDRDASSGDDEAEFAWLPVNALRPFAEGKQEGIGSSSTDPTLQVLRPRHHEDASDGDPAHSELPVQVIHNLHACWGSAAWSSVNAIRCWQLPDVLLSRSRSASRQPSRRRRRRPRAWRCARRLPAPLACRPPWQRKTQTPMEVRSMCTVAVRQPRQLDGQQQAVDCLCRLSRHAVMHTSGGVPTADQPQGHDCARAGWGLPPPSEQTPTPRRGGRGRGRRGGRARGGRGMKGRGRGWRRGGGRGDDFDSVSSKTQQLTAQAAGTSSTCTWQEAAPDADAP